MSQTPSHILENLQTALPSVAKAIKGGWDNIQNFTIKTNSSVSLPIWSCTLDGTEGGRWNGLQAEDAEEEDEDGTSDSEEDEEVKVVKEKQASGKGRKRASNSDEEMEDVSQPRKKSKAANGTPTANVKVPSPHKIGKLAAADVDSSLKKPKSKEIVTSSLNSVSPSKKGKQVKAPVTAEDVISPPESRSKGPELTQDKGKKRKSEKQRLSFASPSSILAVPDVPLKKTKSIKPEGSTLTKAVPSPSPSRRTVPLPAQDELKNDKQRKGAGMSHAFGGPPTASISKEEMKQKRSANIGEKKKKIVIKSKGGKSMKNAVLGKRVAQE